MIQTCLDRAADCLAMQSPQEYVKQMATASAALQKARQRTGTSPTGGATMTALDELRNLLEPGGK
jgi:hypothetical protein